MLGRDSFDGCFAVILDKTIRLKKHLGISSVTAGGYTQLNFLPFTLTQNYLFILPIGSFFKFLLRYKKEQKKLT